MAEQNIERLNVIELTAVEATIQRLTIRDGLGQACIIAESDELGPVVYLLGTNGQPRLTLRVVDDVPHIRLNDGTDDVSLINCYVSKG